jgi:hypothetical protein
MIASFPTAQGSGMMNFAVPDARPLVRAISAVKLALRLILGFTFDFGKLNSEDP